MSFGAKYIPLKGVNVDLAPNKIPNDRAVFIKNLVYSIDDTSTSGKSTGGDTGIFKTFQANSPYVKDFVLPDGDNYCIGALSSSETRQVFVWVYNSKKDHVIYVIDGENESINVMLRGSYLNLQLNPENFIHVGGAALFVLYVNDPDTGLKKRKTFISWVDNFNVNRFTCVEDAIATGGFDETIFSYFSGDYNHENFINAGVTPDQECVSIEEIELDESEIGNSKLLFNGWQFRTRWIDVWGRPSDWSIISDLYLPGVGGCSSSVFTTANCLNLTFNVPPPNIDKVEVAFRRNNDLQWYKADTIELFKGSPLGKWWDRERNTDIDYSTIGSKIVYRFCADKECSPISPSETTRLFNPIPNKSVSAAPVGKMLAYSNNEYGFNPVPKEITEKISFSISNSAVTQGESESRNIVIYVAIYNIFERYFTKVHRDGEIGYSWGRDGSRRREYKQYFKNANQSGFNGYLVGGGSAISSQVYISDENTNEFSDDVDFDGMNLSKLKFNNVGVTLQKFEYNNVRPGKYIFRLSSHLSDPNSDVNYRDTSTTVWGIYSLTPGSVIPNIFDSRVNDSHEILIDVCDSDYDTLTSGEMMVIADVEYYNSGGIIGSSVKTLVTCGYAYEDSLKEMPMELMSCDLDKKRVTDHNGFFYDVLLAPKYIIGIESYIRPIYKCSQTNIEVGGRTDNILFKDVVLDRYNDSYSDFSLLPCNRIQIKGRIINDFNGFGIPGVSVTLTRGRTAITDANGNYTIIAHDDTLNNERNDELIINSGGCRLLQNGSLCIGSVPVKITRCNNCSGERIINIDDVILSTTSTQRGLLSSGVYPVGISLKDYMDRSTFVQDLGYLKIPSTQETKSFSPSRVTVTISDDVVFPSEFKYIVFNVGNETTIDRYITWVVDDFKLIDNTGSVNNSSPTQIKIFYSSLVLYNKKNEYNTTANWGFVQEGTVDQPVTNDNVTFLVNGDGKFFEKSITSRVKYSKDGEYFLINFTEDLKDLKRGAFIRLYRTKQCETQEFMYERCNSIKLNNGVPEVRSFELNAFDTYYIDREIPVPVPDIDIEEPNDDNVSDAPSEVLETKIFAYPFEHDSPSDFWGKGIKNIGRVNVKNPYETVLYKQDEVALSGSFSDNGYINYLSYFEDGFITQDVVVPSKKFIFDKSGLNGIVSMVSKTGVVMLIGQSNNATVGFNDNILRQNKDGSITVASASEIFGRPNVNPLSNYGCSIFDKNSISEYNGVVNWIDTVNAGVIRHDFEKAFDISLLSCSSYVRAKIKEVQKYNALNEGKRYFVGTTNPLNNEYIITDKIIGDKSYFNSLREKNVTYQETVAFDIATGLLKDWRSYTPEYYSYLKGERNDQQLFSMKNGIPYKHYTAITDGIKWGEFFGIPAERIIEVVINADDVKKKKGLFVSVYSHNLYFVDRIITEANQESWIPIPYWRQGNYMWSAPMLCDISGGKANSLMDGDMLYGLWFKIRFVGVPDDNTKYTELTGVTVDIFPEEKSGE